MAESYKDKLLKGQELLEYTRKLKTYIDDSVGSAVAGAEQYTDEAINNYHSSVVSPALDAIQDAIEEEANTRGVADAQLNNKIDQEIENLRQELQSTKIELFLCSRGEYDPNYSDRLQSLFYMDDGVEREVEPSKSYLYLLPMNDDGGDPSTDTDKTNAMNEYIWENDHYELVGSTDVRISKLNSEDIDTIWDEVFNNNAQEPDPEPSPDEP